VAYTFDAANKLVRCDPATTEIVLADLWSRWKDWVLAGNASALPAFDTVGGEIAAIPLYLFPVNGWKIKLPEADRTVRVTGGVLATADNSDPFVDPDGAFTVRVEREAPAIAIGYASGGASGPSSASIAAAVVAALQAVRVPVNVKEMNDHVVIGTGAVGDNWRGVGVPP